MFVIGSNSASTGYNLTRSLRFRSSASAYLNRTVAAGNRQIWTWSSWVKRGTLSTQSFLYQSSDAATGSSYMYFLTDNTFAFNEQSGGSFECKTPGVFRDPSAWYHIVVAYDTTQATAANRIKIYVNGVQQTLTGTFPTQNTQGYINYASFPHRIAQYTGGGNQFDGYLAEVNFVSGIQLAATSFGSFNATTGVWQPIAYSGSYSATNSFYLPFTDNSALTTSSNAGLGKDFSGNGNYWATNNISITAGVTYDSMTDVPTLTSATASNFAVLNPLFNGSATITGGNLNVSVGAISAPTAAATIGVSSGKWYWEVTATSSNNMFGIISSSDVASMTYVGSTSTSYGYYYTGVKYNSASSSSYGASYTTNDVIGVALDLTAGTLTFYKNGSSQGTAFSSLSGTFFPATGNNGVSNSSSFNFGQRPFAYTAPTGFVALNTYNLPTSTIVKGNTVMDATLYTGNGGIQSVTNAAAFKPDLVWNKVRSTANSHVLEDSVRGATKGLYSDSTSAEVTNADFLQSFNSGGFTVGPNALVNQSSATYVAWQWQAGQGSTSSNTNGTITSTVSVNASAGFSIVTYTGNGTNGATVGHGLGVKPSLIIEKGRASTYNWVVQGCGVLWSTATQTLFLNSTSALNPGSAIAAPTSSVFTPAALSYANESGLGYVAYCWTPIAGYSAFGSYSGNNSTDGPMVYTGFQPKFVLIKGTGNASGWQLQDSARNTYNVVNAVLRPDLSAAESTGYGGVLDFLSNGFKLRTTDTNYNSSSYGPYIYMAFATNPFKNSLGF